ncbi:MAG: HdeA/HdeB family chaperone [Crocosphaera sp.]
MKLINKLFGILLLTIIVSQGSIVDSFAQESSEDTKVDLNKISCRELLKMPGKDKELTLVFFHGLMTAKNNQMIIDRIALREATNKITDDCIDNPNLMLMTVFDKYR